MSFVTTACGGAAGGSATPPEPCPHNGAATSEATATVAHQRAQCVIPTSVGDCGGVLPPAHRGTDIHVGPPRGGAVPPPPSGVHHPSPLGAGGDNVGNKQPAPPPAARRPPPPP